MESQPIVLPPKVAIMESCANCSFVFNSTSSSTRTKVVELVIEASHELGSGQSNKVKVGEAFGVVQNLAGREEETDIAVCTQCASPLTRAYVEVKKLSQLRATDSYFSQLLLQQNDLMTISPIKRPQKKGRGKTKSAKRTGKGAKKAVVKGNNTEVKEKPAVKKQRTTLKIPKYRDSLLSAPVNIFNGPYEPTRPSRSAKLTAMVLMTMDKDSAFEKEPPPRKSLPKTNSITKPQEPLPKEIKAPPKEKASKKRKAAPAPTQSKKQKLEEPVTPIEEEVKEDLSVPWKIVKKKSKNAVLNISKATSISPPSRPKPPAEPTVPVEVKPKVDALNIPDPKQRKQKGSKKSNKMEEPPVSKIEGINSTKKEAKPEKRTKISKAKILLPKVFKKIDTESAKDRKKLKGSKVIVPADEEPPRKETAASDQALDLTMSPTAVFTSDVQKPEKTSKKEKVKLSKTNKALNSVETIAESTKATKQSPAVPLTPIPVPQHGKNKNHPKPKEEKKGGDDSKGKKFGCNSCDKTFSARWNLRRHELLVHELASSTPPFICPNCSQVFPVKQAAFEHRMSGPCATTNNQGSPTQQGNNSPSVQTNKSSVVQTNKTQTVQSNKSPPVQANKAPMIQTNKSPPVQNNKTAPVQASKTSTLGANKQTNKAPSVELEKPTVAPKSKKNSHKEKDTDIIKPKNNKPEVKTAAKRKAPPNSETLPPTKIANNNESAEKAGNSLQATSNYSVVTSSPSSVTSGSQTKTKQDALNLLFDSVKAATEKSTTKTPDPAPSKSSSSTTPEKKSKEATKTEATSSTADKSENATDNNVPAVSNNENASSSTNQPAPGNNGASGPAAESNPNGAGVGA